MNGSESPINDQGQTPTSPLVVGGGESPRIETASTGEPDGLHLLTYLLVGGAIEVTDLLLARARQKRATFTAEPTLLPAPSNESNVDLLRYALIGLLIEGERRVREQTLRLSDLVVRSASTATTIASPLTRSWLLAPVRPLFTALTSRGETELARLIHQGRLEEAVSRLLTKEIADDIVSLVLDYMGDKPEIRDLIQSQGTTLAGEVVDEVRGRSQQADTLLETMVHRLFGMAARPPSSPPGP
ncbi:MAG TPA: hypothetical protein PKE45_01525 [Caldilineaceae bacterium]|nr:hypothetical protein [Caldilineaceae bacterium]